MPFAKDSSPCASEEAPEAPAVQLRSRTMSTPPGRNTNRHSYHGFPTALPTNQAFYQPVNRFIHPVLTRAPSLSIPTRTSNDWEQIRCAKKRLSANFGVTLSSLPEDMNPNDTNGRPFVDTLQQGPDLQESPRGSSTASGPTMKPGDGSQPHLVGGMPVQGHLLIDPATGQHYIIPQAYYQPIPNMQPMFYPPPQPQPMYYPYSQPHLPPGYMMPPGTQPQGAYAMPMQPNPAQYVSQASNNRGFPSPLTYRQTYGQTASSTDDLTRQNSIPEEHHPPQSPVAAMTHQFPPGTIFSPAQTSFAQQYRQQLVSHGSTGNLRSSPNSQPEDPESGRDGFRRDVTRSSAEFTPRRSGEFERKGSAEFKGRELPLSDRTPLYGGPPQWWGREEAAESLTDVESRRQRVSPPQIQQATSSDTEANRGPPPPRVPPAPRSVRMDIDFNAVAEKEKAKPNKSSVRSLRMDIDLSKPMPEEEELAKKKVTPRAPATAFTVSFDAPKEGVSLQDAALKSAQVRRVLGRRSGPPNVPSESKGSATLSSGPPAVEAANKNYLLGKLLQQDSNDGETSPDFPDYEERKEADVVSEAGTFVVDVSKRSAGQATYMQRVVENSDDSTDSDTDSDSTPEERSPRSRAPINPPQQTPLQIQPQHSPQLPPQRSPQQRSPQHTSVTPKSDNILQELVKLRQMAGIQSPRTSSGPVMAPTVSIRSSRQQEQTRPATMQNLPPLTKKPSLPQQQTPQQNRSVFGPSSRAPVAVSSTNAFRRGDGGRFSMRGPGTSPQAGLASPQQQQKRPPFRAGGAPARSVVGNQQREQEMNAWLRRKDYNPMKAAAEAKKAKELKSSMTDLSVVSVESETLRGDQFMSNRSISFHVGPGGMPPKPMEYGLTRNRSQESIAEGEAENASQRIVAEYSRGMVKDINRLTQRSNSGGRQQHNGLARAVDLLSQKCKKSIELIRSQNKGCLSVSVEDLLAAAAEPPRATESLNEQLERLSDAFDAVQRYLEQYSLDGHQSPIPEFNEEPMDDHSLVSGFSGISFRSHQIPQDRVPRPLATTSSMANGSPRTSGYRSRVLNPFQEGPRSPQH